MRRATLYSRSPRTQARPAGASVQLPPAAAEAPLAAPVVARASRWRALLARHPRTLGFVGALALVLMVGAAWQAGQRQALPPPLTQKDIDAAVLHTLQTKDLPSRAARAAAAVMPSLVRVRTELPDDRRNLDLPRQRATGSGIIIKEDGTVLTSLHVVVGAERIMVSLHDGTEIEATLAGARPDKDLAVLKLRKLPDEGVQPATLRPTAGLQPGDEVVAVGFPFGIGPSVSAGVVSGLGREHRAGDGRTLLSNLIQFDAAANPGNSGGPLLTLDGQVVGIVAAIMNPTDQAVFIGIGLAVPIEDAAAAAGMPPA
ncbi:trypsin-like peptidase domain-containing protein [uncultured Methylibium sp.]|uniref:S1C family serine protease n=1 Tax=uncultured Methylibium sp. TaxID=381093 RepID=UPI0025F36660|nr:trypsin-like peptidase domain-containing protein [uncultured Methylibium sp.]